MAEDVEASIVGEWKKDKVVAIQRPRYNERTKQLEGQVTWYVRKYTHPKFGIIYRENCPELEIGDGQDLGLSCQNFDWGKRQFQAITNPEYSRKVRKMKVIPGD